MPGPVSASILDHFAELTDPRRREGTYPLINFVAIAICAVISSADDFVAIAHWAKAKREWLSQFLDPSAGLPSHDRFNAIFALLKPAEFEQCLLNWITALHEITGGQIVAIDGKTLRRSFDKASSKSAIHMVSAWATANHVSLGQVVVDQKSNEITAIPKLLELLQISGALVTIDAMGCQAEIAHKIVSQQADYCLAVKGNQPTLHQGIVEFFNDHLEDEFAQTKVRRHDTRESGHGREEARKRGTIGSVRSPRTCRTGNAGRDCRPSAWRSATRSATARTAWKSVTTFSADTSRPSGSQRRCGVIGASRTGCTGNST